MSSARWRARRLPGRLWLLPSAVFHGRQGQTVNCITCHCCPPPSRPAPGKRRYPSASAGAARRRCSTPEYSSRQMQATDYDIPGDFRHWDGDAAEDHIGPFFYRPVAGGIETAFRPRPHNCNSSGAVHGGVLMTFIDYTLCVAAVAGTDERVVTV